MLPVFGMSGFGILAFGILVFGISDFRIPDLESLSGVNASAGFARPLEFLPSESLSSERPTSGLKVRRAKSAAKKSENY